LIIDEILQSLNIKRNSFSVFHFNILFDCLVTSSLFSYTVTLRFEWFNLNISSLFKTTQNKAKSLWLCITCTIIS
jgi:hypothetical protein